MSDIEKLIEEEVAASESDRDAPLRKGSHATRPRRARSMVYSVRLNPDEVAAVQRLAEAAGLPASTLVRSWIVERLHDEQGGHGDAGAELRAAQRHLAKLERHLTQEAS